MFDSLLEHVKLLARTNNDVIITGHSLGGGISHVVAALTHIPSIAFSPPGILEAHRKFSNGAHRLHAREAYHQSIRYNSIGSCVHIL